MTIEEVAPNLPQTSRGTWWPWHDPAARMTGTFHYIPDGGGRLVVDYPADAEGQASSTVDGLVAWHEAATIFGTVDGVPVTLVVDGSRPPELVGPSGGDGADGDSCVLRIRAGCLGEHVAHDGDLAIQDLRLSVHLGQDSSADHSDGLHSAARELLASSAEVSLPGTPGEAAEVLHVAFTPEVTPVGSGDRALRMVHITCSTTDAMSLADARYYSQLFLDFISFVTVSDTSFGSLRLNVGTSAEGEPQHCHYWQNTGQTATSAGILRSIVDISNPHEMTLGECLTAWLDFARSNRPVVRLMGDIFRGRLVSIESTLLAAIAVLESLKGTMADTTRKSRKDTPLRRKFEELDRLAVGERVSGEESLRESDEQEWTQMIVSFRRELGHGGGEAAGTNGDLIWLKNRALLVIAALMSRQVGLSAVAGHLLQDRSSPAEMGTDRDRS